MIKTLAGLKPETYEHPFDREALDKLKKIPCLLRFHVIYF